MKKIMILLASVAFFASCSDDDEKIIPKDYGMKTFSADMKYEAPSGMATDFTCKQQTYMKLGETEAVTTGEYGADSWTTFNILPKVPDADEKLIKNENYNVTTNVDNWDLLFTQYIGNGYVSNPEKVFPYYLTGILINTKKVEVGLYTYETSTEADAINQAFSDLTLNDVSDVTYNSTIDFIGTNWRKMEGMPPTYSPNTNYFYIIKTSDESYYKVRFIGYYGATMEEKVFKCEYALMK